MFKKLSPPSMIQFLVLSLLFLPSQPQNNSSVTSQPPEVECDESKTPRLDSGGDKSPLPIYQGGDFGVGGGVISSDDNLNKSKVDGDIAGKIKTMHILYITTFLLFICTF